MLYSRLSRSTRSLGLLLCLGVSGSLLHARQSVDVGSAVQLGTLNDNIVHTGTLSPADATDWMTFTVPDTSPGPDVLRVELRLPLVSLNQPTDIVLARDVDGDRRITPEEILTTAFTAPPVNPDAVILQWLDEGIYYARVQAPHEAINGSYRLEVSRSPGTGSTGSSGRRNNLPGGATRLGALGAPITLSEFVGASDPIDWYSFEVPDVTSGPDILQVTLAVNPLLTQLVIRVEIAEDQNANGAIEQDEVLAALDGGPATDLNVLNVWLEQGHYLLLVRPAGDPAFTSGTYELTLSRDPLTGTKDSVGRADNTPASAVHLGRLVQDRSVADFVGTPDVVDWYRFDVVHVARRLLLQLDPDSLEAPLGIEIVQRREVGGNVSAGTSMGSVDFLNPLLDVRLDPGSYLIHVPAILSSTKYAFRLSDILPAGTAPFVTLAPMGRIEVVEGGIFEARVEADDSSPLTYQWYRGEEALAGQTSDRIQIAGITPAQAGLYRVVVSNSFGTVQTTTTELSVLPNPNLSIDGAVLVSWPSDRPGLVLASSTSADGPWVVLDRAPDLRDGRYQVVVPTTPGPRFFRLQNP